MADLPGASGEIGVLSSAFEVMLERLTAAQREAIHQSRLALLGEIAASLAHDVRTPLSVLKTSAQLLAAGQVPAAEQRDLARMVAAEVDRLNGVVSRLVDLARPHPVQVAPQPVEALVESATAVLRPWARSAGVAIEVPADGGELRVRVDRDQMQQVLMNLVHNAVQAASKPGRVALRWYRSPPWAVIEVEDSGAGFTTEALARAFSPFFTTKPEGVGLGLAIVKRLVEEQGGEVGARNVDAGGACVWIRLPLAQEAA
jgi:signal transduction histidine kinase